MSFWDHLEPYWELITAAGTILGPVLSAFTTARPCDKKANRPPGREALEEKARLPGPIGRQPVVDLSVYGEIVGGRR